VHRVLLILNILGTLVAYTVMLLEIESVLVSGPLLCLLGALTMVSALRIKHAYGIAVGGAQIAISLLFFALVNILAWGPSEAETPFALLGLAYMVAFLPVAISAMSRTPQVDEWERCLQCGYLLYGLTTARCPECGRPFDPALLSDLARV
jgi:hypothetical protein